MRSVKLTHYRTMRGLALFAVLVLAGTISAQASGALALVDTLISALNTKNPELLDSIYQGYFPHTQCNSFELLLANVMANSSFYSKVLVLQSLEKSSAVLTVPPRIIETISETISQSGRIMIVFGFDWSYVAKGEEGQVSEELSLSVSWELKEYDDGFRVIHQRTTPCGPGR